MCIKALLNAVGLVDERLKNKIGNGNSLALQILLRLFESYHYRLREIPRRSGHKKTALAAAVIQQGKAFRVRHPATVTELFSAQVAFKLDAQFSQTSLDNLFAGFLTGTGIRCSGLSSHLPHLS
jgi:hypothetical protein